MSSQISCDNLAGGYTPITPFPIPLITPPDTRIYFVIAASTSTGRYLWGEFGTLGKGHANARKLTWRDVKITMTRNTVTFLSEKQTTEGKCTRLLGRKIGQRIELRPNKYNFVALKQRVQEAIETSLSCCYSGGSVCGYSARHQSAPRIEVKYTRIWRSLARTSTP
jgi:hypothetical protein